MTTIHALPNQEPVDVVRFDPVAPEHDVLPAGDPCPPAEIDAALAQTLTKIDNLQTALASCRIIAIALGITMERLQLTEPDAFALLRSVSQTRHRKLRDVASELVFSGEIPTSR